MPIYFNDEQNKFSYTGRVADESWKKAVLSLVHPNGLNIADVGCGGGIYSRAWLDLGARKVTGIDSSPVMISAAVESCIDLRDASFQVGDATNTGLPDNSVDIVFERALIHHLSEIRPCFNEAIRILKPGGRLIIQDRTQEDVTLQGSPEHIRGYFFECFPRLLEVESKRRRTTEAIVRELDAAQFKQFESISLWETRKVHSSINELNEDIRQRRGRSILHELNDVEIINLVSYINDRIPNHGSITEKDHWTIYSAQKPIS